MTAIIQGIEGDDLSFHIRLLGNDINRLPNDVWFYPLNDHYNIHSASWHDAQVEQINRARTVVFYDLVNTGDYEHSRFVKFVEEFEHPNKYYLTVNQSNIEIPDVKIIQWDFMWNRIKAYYTASIPEELHLHHYSYGNYKLFDLDFNSLRNKKFLSMTGREYGYRTNLYNFVKDYDGYISNRSLGITLENTEVMGAFNPVPNNFYLDSYFSFYVESNCQQQNLIHITEKTFEPLIKGHFILPVSNPGTIRRLRDLGFAFPKFIDYSFDEELDTVQRFELIKLEFKRLLDLDWHTLYKDNQDILIHNQRCIFSIPYDRRLLEIFNV